MVKLLLLLIAGLAIQINGENVPVFLWGPKTISFFPALQHLGGEEFLTLIQSQSNEDTKTVVFIENKLSVEDFSQCSTKRCFENLRKIEDKTFLNSVEDPVESIVSSSTSKKSLSLSSDDDLKNIDGDEKILLVQLDEVESAEDFDRHDELMSKVFKELQAKYANVVAIYTGRNPSFKYSEKLKRTVREASEEKVPEVPATTSEAAVVKPKPKQGDGEIVDHTRPWNHPPHFINQDDTILFAVNSIWIDNTNVTETAPPTISYNIAEGNFDNMTVTITALTHNIILEIYNTSGNWKVDAFWYNNELYYPRSRVYGFGERWSFGCGNLTLEAAAPRESTTRKSIHFIGFRFQPSFTRRVPEGDEPNIKFGPCNDCTGFFSPAIWGALFVIIILVSILFYGLSSMMEIRTMDRFDDPKGKTIIINAAD